jgi:multidrug resistance protein, MATE family
MIITSFIKLIRNRWNGESGWREILHIAFPLILSTSSWSVLQFVDRMFLAWYSPEAIAAAMPSGILNYTISCLFIGTATYVSTFVAQYHGAGQDERIGAVVRQGALISLMGGIVLLALIPFAGPFFDWVGHEPAVRAYEKTFFRILCLGGFPAILTVALSGFFSGRGNTVPVMWVNIFATVLNLTLDYLLIFGNFGFPRWGVAGAAIATVISMVCSCAVFLIIMAKPEYIRRYRLLKGGLVDLPLLGRILRFGFPNGVQFFLDVAGFSVFLLLVGRLGTSALAATNIAFNINTLAFMPMIGLGIAVSILVGQRLGRNDPPSAERAVWSGFQLTFLYMGTVALLYVVIPNLFLAPFFRGAGTPEDISIRDTAVVLLRFVALYSLFDTMNIIFSSALKGAGDTRFIMYLLMILSLGVLIIPSWIALIVLHAGVYVGWCIASAYVCLLGIAFLLRFLAGKWKSMRVIETPPSATAPLEPQKPCAGFEG